MISYFFTEEFRMFIISYSGMFLFFAFFGYCISLVISLLYKITRLKA